MARRRILRPTSWPPAAYVVNLDTNIVVYEKNSETPLQAASLTKMMTTLLLLENYQDQLDTITVTAPQLYLRPDLGEDDQRLHGGHP